MLLGHVLLAAARVWQARERIEKEAALLFTGVAVRLADCGEDAKLVGMAERAAADEWDHAVRCRAIVDALHPGLPELDVPPTRRLGPASLGARNRVLYETVAMGCVTESLSCGLLLAMRNRATHPLVAQTIQHILKDEVRHSRVGWAHLALAAGNRDVAWLGQHVNAMLRAALRSDVVPICADDRSPEFGVLSHTESDEVVRQTVESVIVPGMAEFGIAIRGDAL